MEFHIHHHQIRDDNILLAQRLDWLYAQTERLHSLLEQVISNQEKIMSSLDDVLAEVTQESGEIDSMVTLLAQLEEQVKGITSGNLPPDVQAKVDAIFTEAKANSDKIVAAINAAPGSTPPTVAAPLPSTGQAGGTAPATPPSTASSPAGPAS